VEPANRTFRDYRGCYPVDAVTFSRARVGTCLRGHVQDPLQDDNKGKPMTEAKVVGDAECD
jgi:hypothetical protein